MFKAFFWMFQRKDLCKSFFLNSIVILLVAAIIMAIFCLSGYMVLINKYTLYGYLGTIFALGCALLLTYFVWGYFWELTASIIERKSDILSSSIYGGQVSVVEVIELPKIEFFKFCWRGFSSSIAMLIMELPVVLLLFSILLFFDKSYIYVIYVVQILIWFLLLGLFWNYAKNNSIFSMLNVYIAGYLIENHPLRYIWNTILNIINYALYYAVVLLVALLLHVKANTDYTNFYDCIRLAGAEFALLLPFFYLLHVQAYLVGTLSPNDDYM